MNFRRFVASVSLDGGTYLRELEERIDDIATELYKCGEQLAAERHRCEFLVKEHDAVARELAATQGERDALRDRVAELQAEVAYQTTRAQNLEVEAAMQRRELEEAAKAIEFEASAHAREMIAMRAAVNEANARIDELLRRESGESQLPLVDLPDAPPPAKPEVVSDTTQRRVYQIVKLALEGGYKWYFTDGGAETFNAAILDKEFAAKVDRREVAFAHGDALEVDVHIVSTRTGKQLKSQYEFVKVHRHLVPDEQPSLPFNANAEPASATEGVVS